MDEDSSGTTKVEEEAPPEIITPQKVPEWGPATSVLLEDWHFRVTRAQFGHQISADKTHLWHLFLGVPVVIVTTVVGTAAFAAINQETDNFWKVAAGTISIAAAVLASVQTFFGFGERSDRHRIAATRYASTRRSIELALTSHDGNAVPFIKGEMDRTGGSSPQIDRKKWIEAGRLAKEALEDWHRQERRIARAEAADGKDAGAGHGSRENPVRDQGQ